MEPRTVLGRTVLGRTVLGRTVLGQLRKMPMGKFGLSIATRRAARRVAAVNAYEFPSSVRQRVRFEHPNLGSESLALVEAATRQWFRLLARRPTARLGMPSTVVDHMWHELMLHTRDYAAFCDAAFGRFLHHQPESAMTPAQAAANRAEHLLATWWLAREDEGCEPDVLPLLFRVDHEVGLDGARRYIANCGGERGRCYDKSSPNLVCLTHLTGSRLTGSRRPPPDQVPDRSRRRHKSPDNTPWMAHGCGGSSGVGDLGGGGCGSGCGGG